MAIPTLAQKNIFRRAPDSFILRKTPSRDPKTAVFGPWILWRRALIPTHAGVAKSFL